MVAKRAQTNLSITTPAPQSTQQVPPTIVFQPPLLHSPPLDRVVVVPVWVPTSGVSLVLEIGMALAILRGVPSLHPLRAHHSTSHRRSAHLRVASSTTPLQQVAKALWILNLLFHSFLLICPRGSRAIHNLLRAHHRGIRRRGRVRSLRG